MSIIVNEFPGIVFDYNKQLEPFFESIVVGHLRQLQKFMHGQDYML